MPFYHSFNSSCSILRVDSSSTLYGTSFSRMFRSDGSHNPDSLSRSRSDVSINLTNSSFMEVSGKSTFGFRTTLTLINFTVLYIIFWEGVFGAEWKKLISANWLNKSILGVQSFSLHVSTCAQPVSSCVRNQMKHFYEQIACNWTFMHGAFHLHRKTDLRERKDAEGKGGDNTQVPQQVPDWIVRLVQCVFSVNLFLNHDSTTTAFYTH